ncbi:OTU-domain-containing protein [Hypoxylon sp. FL1857]|nr:OTU-domain-containing protein [Hypoxylon sp. FL1857]
MESLETMQARHRKEQRDLQARITNKKKNATKKTRKGVNDECAELERQLKEKQAEEITALNGDGDDGEDVPNGQEGQQDDEESQHRQVNGTTPADATNGIAQQLKQTTLSQSADLDPPTQQQQPKKRNRQKERMARRAAEQEAAAEAAEQEAANMTDHRKIEKTYLLKEFKANNLVEKEIQPDGHCLFSAIADQLQTRGLSLGPETETKGKPPYRIIRKAATDYMEAHPDDFAPFLEEPLGSYVPKIRDTAEWGGQLELSALANAYGVEIKVLQDGRTETIEPNGNTGSEQDGERKKIWLAYYRHGYGLGEHYNSLRKAA